MHDSDMGIFMGWSDQCISSGTSLFVRSEPDLTCGVADRSKPGNSRNIAVGNIGAVAEENFVRTTWLEYCA